MRIVSIVVGAALMYFLDPSNGIRRRQWLRDQWVSFRPLFTSLKHTLQPSEGVPALDELPYTDSSTLNADWDKALLLRVEEAVTQHISPPRSISVKVEDGVVTLTGRALLPEIALVMEHVSTLPGVVEVENHIKVSQDTQEHLESQSTPIETTTT